MKNNSFDIAMKRDKTLSKRYSGDDVGWIYCASPNSTQLPHNIPSTRIYVKSYDRELYNELKRIKQTTGRLSRSELAYINCHLRYRRVGKRLMLFIKHNPYEFIGYATKHTYVFFDTWMNLPAKIKLDREQW